MVRYTEVKSEREKINKEAANMPKFNQAKVVEAALTLIGSAEFEFQLAEIAGNLSVAAEGDALNTLTQEQFEKVAAIQALKNLTGKLYTELQKSLPREDKDKTDNVPYYRS
jgi:hypothetical protein